MNSRDSRGDAVLMVDAPAYSPIDTERLLTPTLSFIEATGIRIEDVQILVVCPVAKRVGRDDIGSISKAVTRYPVFVHDPDASDELVSMGRTPTNGTPVTVNRLLSVSDVRIAVSAIVPDVYTGATGGFSPILPGSSGLATVLRHRHLYMEGPFGLCSIDSPVVTDMRECSEMVGMDLIVNVVLDWQGSPVRVLAGEPSCWEDGVNTLRQLSRVPLRRKADITVVGAGGHPSDRTLYDAADALVAGMAVTRRNGAIVLVAECPEGVGPSGFIDTVGGCSSSEAVATLARRRFRIGMEKAALFWRVLEHMRIVIVSTIDDSIVDADLHCSPAHSVEEAMEIAQRLVGEHMRTAVLPAGNSTLPLMQELV